MPRLPAALALALLLQSCGLQPQTGQRDVAAQALFRDASRCIKSAQTKERVQVPSGASVSVVEITLSYNAAAFEACMEQAGHPKPLADPGAYLTVARKCIPEAGGAADPNAAYAECLRHNGIIVEPLPAGETE